MSYSALDPLVLDADEREAAYTFKNLNYVKAKLFDPEITYLHTKFTEALREVKQQMIDENKKMADEYKSLVHNDLEFLKTLAFEIQNLNVKNLNHNNDVKAIMEQLFS